MNNLNIKSFESAVEHTPLRKKSKNSVNQSVSN
jgi:hypothetical protein